MPRPGRARPTRREQPPTTTIVLVATVALLAVPAATLADHGGAHTWTQTDKLWPPEPSPNRLFGASLAADEHLLAVGPGPVQVYAATGTGWTLQQTIEAPSETFEDREHLWGSPNGRCFGHDVALDATAGILVVGDPCLDVPGNLTHHERDAGAIYIYERQPDASWTLEGRFLGPVNGDWNDLDSSGNDNFGPSLGFSLAAEGNTIVAGAPFAVVDGTPLRGIVAVLEHAPDGNWTQAANWTSPFPDAATWDRFGEDVAIGDDRIAVGAPSEATDLGELVGAVHLYEHVGDSWTHTARVTPALAHTPLDDVRPPGDTLNGTDTGASFGEALALDEDGSTLVVGSSWGNRLAGLALPTSTDADTPLPLVNIDRTLTNPWGVAYVYDRTDGDWSHAASLENPDREAHSGFGRDLAVDDTGDTVVVGAYLGHQSEAVASVNGETVGTPAPVSDHGLVTHHPATGAAYVFERSGGWDCSAQLAGDDTGSTGAHTHGDDFFGTGVAITASSAWVGAPNNGDNDRGTVYAFDPSEPTLSLPAMNSQTRCGLR